jgi:hypothetical protein
MKNLATALVVMICGLTVRAQTLNCGNVTLQIGMPQAQARQALTDGGYKLSTTYDSIQTMFNEGAEESCDIVFGNGKLSYVSRSWAKGIKNETEAVGKAIDAIQSVTHGQKSLCTVFPWRSSEPASSSKSVSIMCGSHTITLKLLVLAQAHERPDMTIYDIEESVGDIQPHAAPRHPQ